MNDEKLDAALAALAEEKIGSPDLGAAVHREIRRRSAGSGRPGFPSLPVPLLSAALFAAVVVGIGVSFYMPGLVRPNPQTEAANALHMDIFNPATVQISSARLPLTER